MPESTQRQKVTRVLPPKEFFASSAMPVAMMHELPASQTNTPTYRIDTPPEGGVLNWQLGSKYPVKQWVFKEAIFAVDCIKRAVMNALRLATSSPARYLFAPIILVPNIYDWKGRLVRKAIEEFGDYAMIVFDRWGRLLPFEDEQGNQFGLQGIVINPQYYCTVAREVRRVGMEMAGDWTPGRQFVEAVCMTLEFDDAYRYRAQDLMGEMNQPAFLANPAKEATRIMRIAMQRGKGTEQKFQQFALAIPFLFRIGIIRKTMLEFFSKVDMTKLYLDTNDLYRCLIWGGWNFQGVPDIERVSIRLMIDAEWMEQERKTRETTNIPRSKPIYA